LKNDNSYTASDYIKPDDTDKECSDNNEVEDDDNNFDNSINTIKHTAEELKKFGLSEISNLDTEEFNKIKKKEIDKKKNEDEKRRSI
jgi:hypothetical protein